MSSSSKFPADEDIARLSHALWERDGSPHGRDQEYWFRARQELLARGGSEGPDDADEAREPRRVQPGFQDAAPGIVPDMKQDPSPELPESPGGRFAKQVAGTAGDGDGAASTRPSAKRARSEPKKRGSATS